MLITLEGPEGAGKSTLAKALADRLSLAGQAPLLTYEPGGTELGRQLREIVLHGPQRVHGPQGAGGAGQALGQASIIDVTLSPRAETLLFCAARAQLVDEVIRPHLAAGGVVVCDRYADSTLAYQCYGRGLPIAPVRETLAFATAGLWPDLTVLLDLDVREGLRRKRALDRGADVRVDRFEAEALDFQERVRRGYRELAAAEPERWLVVDASLPPGRVLDIVWSGIEWRLRIKAGGGRQR